MKSELVVILDNIRSLYNVGSIFRTADAVGVDTIYLCGITGTPEHPRFKHNQTRDPDVSLPERVDKTALAGLDATPWERTESTYETIKQLKEDVFTIIALEKTDTSIPISELIADSWQLPAKTALVLGNERVGVDKEVLSIADHIVHIPMHGQGVSLNVAVAFGIAAYTLQNEEKTAAHPEG